VTVVVGGGGAGSPASASDEVVTGPGGNGAPGEVSITWTAPPAPTCSVSAVTNPLPYGNSTTLNWSSTNSNTSFYISNVGYVTPNSSGSATVGPLATTAYNGTAAGPGGTAQCNYTITVNPPATCTFNGNTVTHGSSITAYQSATVPYGSSCTSQSRTCSNGTLSGSYAYASCTVDNPPPSCTPETSYSCSSNSIVQTATSSACEVVTNHSYATCNPPSYCSAGLFTCVTPIPSGSITASPKLVNRGGSVHVIWNTTNTAVCSVTGNGDAWSTTSGNQLSTAIMSPVTYSLSCDNGAHTGSVFILPIPGWREF
jgi:hypothetical protein